MKSRIWIRTLSLMLVLLMTFELIGTSVSAVGSGRTSSSAATAVRVLDDTGTAVETAVWVTRPEDGTLVAKLEQPDFSLSRDLYGQGTLRFTAIAGNKFLTADSGYVPELTLDAADAIAMQLDCLNETTILAGAQVYAETPDGPVLLGSADAQGLFDLHMTEGTVRIWVVDDEKRYVLRTDIIQDGATLSHPLGDAIRNTEVFDLSPALVPLDENTAARTQDYFALGLSNVKKENFIDTVKLGWHLKSESDFHMTPGIYEMQLAIFDYGNNGGYESCRYYIEMCHEIGRVDTAVTNSITLDPTVIRATMSYTEPVQTDLNYGDPFRFTMETVDDQGYPVRTGELHERVGSYSRQNRPWENWYEFEIQDADGQPITLSHTGTQINGKDFTFSTSALPPESGAYTVQQPPAPPYHWYQDILPMNLSCENSLDFTVSTDHLISVTYPAADFPANYNLVVNLQIAHNGEILEPNPLNVGGDPPYYVELPQADANGMITLLYDSSSFTPGDPILVRGKGAGLEDPAFSSYTPLHFLKTSFTGAGQVIEMAAGNELQPVALTVDGEVPEYSGTTLGVEWGGTVFSMPASPHLLLPADEYRLASYSKKHDQDYKVQYCALFGRTFTVDTAPVEITVDTSSFSSKQLTTPEQYGNMNLASVINGVHLIGRDEFAYNMSLPGTLRWDDSVSELLVQQIPNMGGDMQGASFRQTLLVPKAGESTEIPVGDLTQWTLIPSQETFTDQDSVVITSHAAKGELTFTALERIKMGPKGNVEGVEPIAPSYRYRLAENTAWTDAPGGSWTGIDLGVLPAGSYELEVSFTVPENTDCPIASQTASCTFQVGTGISHQISLSAPANAKDTVEVTVNGTPGAVAEVYCLQPGQQDKTKVAGSVIPESGVWVVTVPLSREGTYEFYAVSTLDENTAEADPIRVISAAILPQDVTLSVTAQGDRSLEINWTVPPHADILHLYRDNQMIQTFQANVTSYLDENLDPQRTYTYYMLSETASGLISSPVYASGRPIQLPDTQPPTAPQKLVAQAGSRNIRLNWTRSVDNERISGYEVYRDGKLVGRTSGRRWYSDETVMPDRTYVYTVKAVDGSGNLSEPSPACSVVLYTEEAIGSFEAKAETNADGSIIGSALDVTAITGAQTGNLAVTISYRHNGEEKTVQLPMESLGGRWTGQWEIPKGAEEIISVSASARSSSGLELQKKDASGYPRSFATVLHAEAVLVNAGYAPNLLKNQSSVTLTPEKGQWNYRSFTKALTAKVGDPNRCTADFAEITPGTYTVTVTICGKTVFRQTNVTVAPHTIQSLSCDAGGLYRFRMPKYNSYYIVSPFSASLTDSDRWLKDNAGDTAFPVSTSSCLFLSYGGWMEGEDGLVYQGDRSKTVSMEGAADYVVEVPISSQNGVPAFRRQAHFHTSSGKSLGGLTVYTSAYTDQGVVSGSFVLDGNNSGEMVLPDLPGLNQIYLHTNPWTFTKADGSFSHMVASYNGTISRNTASINEKIDEIIERRIQISLTTDQDPTGAELDGVICTLAEHTPSGGVMSYRSVALKNGKASLKLEVPESRHYTLRFNETLLKTYRKLNPTVLTEGQFTSVLNPVEAVTQWYSLEFRDVGGLSVEGVKIHCKDKVHSWDVELPADGRYEVEAIKLCCSAVSDSMGPNRKPSGTWFPYGVPIEEKGNSQPQVLEMQIAVGVNVHNKSNLYYCNDEYSNSLRPWCEDTLWIAPDSGKPWTDRGSFIVNSPAPYIADTSPEFWENIPGLTFKKTDLLNGPDPSWEKPEILSLRVTDLSGIYIPFSVMYYTRDGQLAAWGSNEDQTYKTDDLLCAVVPGIYKSKLEAKKAFDSCKEDSTVFIPVDMTSTGFQAVTLGIQSTYSFRLEDETGRIRTNGFGTVFDNDTGLWIGDLYPDKNSYLLLSLQALSVKDIIVYFGWKGDLGGGSNYRQLSFWESRSDVTSIRINPRQITDQQTVRLPYKPIYQYSLTITEFVPRPERVIRLEDGRFLVQMRQGGTFYTPAKLVLPKGAQEITIDGSLYTDYEKYGGIHLQPMDIHRITFVITQENLMKDNTYEGYIEVNDPDLGKFYALQFTQRIDSDLLSVAIRDQVSSNEVTFLEPKSKNGAPAAYHVPYYAVTPVGGTYWGRSVDLYGLTKKTYVSGSSYVYDDADRGDDPDYTIADYHETNPQFVEGAWASMNTTIPDFQLAVRVDGIPVDIEDYNANMVNMMYTSSGSGSSSSSSRSWRGTLGCPNTGMSGSNPVYRGAKTDFELNTERGVYDNGPVVWLSAYKLKENGLYDPETGDIYSLIPMKQPESYPHVYHVEFFLRYKLEDGTFQVEKEERSIQLNANAPILQKWDYTHLQNSGDESEASPLHHVNIRSKADREDFHRQLKSSDRLIVYWNDCQLFTFRAWFDRPEAVKNVRAVADVDDSCRFNSFPMEYDPEQGCFVGTGQLGDVYTLPQGYTVTFQYKDALMTEDGRMAISMNDLEANAELDQKHQAEGTLPDGWNIRLAGAENGWSLQKCLDMWTAYAESVQDGLLSKEDLTPLLDENGRLYYPSLEVYDEGSQLVHKRESYLYFGESPIDGTGTDFVITRDGSIEAELNQKSQVSEDGLTGMVCLESASNILLPTVYETSQESNFHTRSLPGAIAKGAKKVVDYAMEPAVEAAGVAHKAVSKGLEIKGHVDNLGTVTDLLNPHNELLPEYKDLYREHTVPDPVIEGAKMIGGAIPFGDILLAGEDLILKEITGDMPAKIKHANEIAVRNQSRMRQWMYDHGLTEEDLKNPELLDDELDDEFMDEPYPEVKLEWHIDPSGYVFEGTESNRLDGVTATVFQQQKDGSWQPWNSELYDEGPNPNITDVNGDYGWDVLPGNWKVTYQKEGYYDTESKELPVPPPHLDVNISMVSDLPAAVEEITPLPEGLEFTFDRPVAISDAVKMTSVLSTGEALDGTIRALDGGPVASGNKQKEDSSHHLLTEEVATRFLFTPAEAADFVPGAMVQLDVQAGIRTYNSVAGSRYTSDLLLIPEKAPERAPELTFTDDNRYPEMQMGESVNMNDLVSFTGDQTPVWTSLTPAVAKITAGGAVTSVAPGVAVFRASIGESYVYHVSLYVDLLKPNYPEGFKFYVRFEDTAGREIETQAVAPGSAATPPQAPYMSGWEFTGWDSDISHVNESMTVKPIYSRKAVASTAEVTFEIFNGSWADGSKTHKTVTVSLEDGFGTLDADLIPTGMTPDAGYENGSWDLVPNTSKNGVTGPVTYIYRFRKRVPVITTTQVTFCVENGTWSDGSVESQTVEITLRDGVGTLDRPMIPTGMIPADGYEAGSWNPEPDLSAGAVTGPVTYTYVFSPHIPEITSADITFHVLNGTWSDGTADPRIVTITLTDGRGTLDASQVPVNMIGFTGYADGRWNVWPDTSANAVTGPTEYTFQFTEHVHHVFGPWEITQPSTQTEKGSKVHTCKVCGYRETEEIPCIPFDDIRPNAYYAKPVTWAVSKDIAQGMTPTEFWPEHTCTRGQIVTFIWRTMGCPEPVSDSNPFTDIKPGDYCYNAVLWAVEKGITNGMTPTTFMPNLSCTRGHAVTFLHRALGAPTPGSRECPFTDVSENRFYYDPILWAVEHQITDGMTPTGFWPEYTCTRGQIVTFLYRAFPDT